MNDLPDLSNKEKIEIVIRKSLSQLSPLFELGSEIENEQILKALRIDVDGLKSEIDNIKPVLAQVDPESWHTTMPRIRSLVEAMAQEDVEDKRSYYTRIFNFDLEENDFKPRGSNYKRAVEAMKVLSPAHIEALSVYNGPIQKWLTKYSGHAAEYQSGRMSVNELRRKVEAETFSRHNMMQLSSALYGKDYITDQDNPNVERMGLLMHDMIGLGLLYSPPTYDQGLKSMSVIPTEFGKYFIKMLANKK